MVREIPLLMQPEMAHQSILGNKTETRRLVGLNEINEHPERYHLSKETYIDKKGRFCQKLFSTTGVHRIAVCPYGKVDDFLWIRENWNKDGFGGFIYAADFETRDAMRWRPSIHLKKFASRLWVQSVYISLERLHNITEEAAIAEGVENIQGFGYIDYEFDYDTSSRIELFNNAKDSYSSLWKSINGKAAWESNPWVWVIKYQVMSTTGRPDHLLKREMEVANG
jgi:hypothetical protein